MWRRTQLVLLVCGLLASRTAFGGERLAAPAAVTAWTHPWEQAERTSSPTAASPEEFSAAAQQALGRAAPAVSADVFRGQSAGDAAIEQASYNVACPPQRTVCCPPADRTWALIAPYGWLSAMNGTVTINNTTLPIDLSLSDLIDIMKNDLRGAAMIHAEAGRGRFGFILDGMLVSAASSQTRGPLTANVQVDQTFLEFLNFYRLVDASDTEVPWTVDVLGGARYYDLDVNGQFILGNIITFNRGQTNNWVDLVVGVRSAVALTESLEAFGRFDVGGFGIGTSSDPAWNVQGGLKYQVAWCEGLSLVSGYKYLAIDEDHSPGSPDAFGFHVEMFGPFAAIAYEF